MAKNKMSIWAIVILVVTIVLAAFLLTSVIAFSTSISTVMETARAEAAKHSTDPAEIDLIAGAAVGVIIAAFAASAVVEVLQIIGGFLFSLKGRWGIFCIIMSIISAATNLWELISDITNRAGALSIVSTSICLVLSIVIVIACFKHRAENRA